MAMPSSPESPARERERPEGGLLARAAMRTQPLPLTYPAPPRRTRRFAARPFLSVLGYYALGVFAFLVMVAAGNAPGAVELPWMAWRALEITGPVALLLALAAGRWWV
ncbi:hypothetical protein GCM10023165_56140 [Variovorax defluvii]|uniref:Uncharacterized protein n=1 Tax=Variovorax defluvii TaxID=913761 RepID=A0ABP8IIV5_9BURK